MGARYFLHEAGQVVNALRISTDFALKHAHLPRIVGSTTIDGLENRTRGELSDSMGVHTERPRIAFCAAPCRD